MKKPLFLFFIFYYTFHFGQDECGQAGGYTGVLIEKEINGAKKEENVYLNGVKHGVCISYYLDGTIRSKEKYQLGKFIELLLAPDPTHDAKDYKTLHPTKNYNYNYTPPKIDPKRKKWKSDRVKINDSTETEKGYFDNRLAIERIYIKGDKRYERFYFRDNDGPDNYFNRNYEAHYYYGKLHGESISYFTNGNIQQKGTYYLYEPIGLHYTYYNNTQHIIKSITCYSNNTEQIINKQSGPIYKKNFDTTGSYSGYELKNTNANKPFKTVVFSDTTKLHTWSYSGFFQEHPCYISGTIENGYYKILGAQTKDKKNVLKNGNYSGTYINFIDALNETEDTADVPKNKGSNTTWLINSIENIASFDFRNHLLHQTYNNFEMFTLPLEKWKGKLKDGYLTGNWVLKEKYFLQNDITTTVLFSGKFEKSRREGVWHYENDLYQYDITYVNGKKEGELKLTLKNYDMKKLQQKKYNENERYYYGDGENPYNYPKNLPETYNNLLSLMVGSFKNNEMRGEWLIYYKYPDLLAFKAIYNHGVLIGKTEEYNIKQQLTAKRIIQNNKIISEKLYTPLGDLYDKKFLLNGGEDFTLREQKNNKPDGKYLHWNNYTSEVYEKGFYKNGMKNDEWFNFSYGDTLIQHYKNDTLNGFYRYNNLVYNHNYQMLSTGSYSDGKQSGLWRTNNSFDSLYKEEVFMDNEKYLITYIDKNKKMVEKGSGVVLTSENGLLTKSEEYYKDGKIFKTILIYTQNNQTASIIYSTPHGDSIAYYMPPESGTCIKNGTGMKTYFDYKKRISKIEYYIKGKIIKNDLYNDGRLSNTYYYRFASDTTENLKGKVLVEKEISKPFNENTYLYITIRITNMPKNITSLTIADYCNSIYELEITDSDGFNVSQKTTGSFHLVRNKPITSNVIEIKYKYQSNNGETFGNNAKIRYSIDKKHYELSPYYYRIH